MNRIVMAIAAASIAFAAIPAAAADGHPHNVVLFVPDGLRAVMVSPENAPAMADCATRA